MKMHKHLTDQSAIFGQVFPILDNEFDTDIDGATCLNMLDWDMPLACEAIQPGDNDFDPLE